MDELLDNFETDYYKLKNLLEENPEDIKNYLNELNKNKKIYIAKVFQKKSNHYNIKKK